VEAFSKENGVELKAVELDVASDASAEAGIAKVIAAEGHIDTIIHNAGHMSFGPAEAFTPEQYAELFDINVLSTQRVNRAVLPHLRKQGKGLVSGFLPPAPAAVRLRTLLPISPPRPPWTRLPFPMPVS
jgi:NADP-dependent 3-hydroxy acid dehydrogenase YdfG